MHSDFRKIPYKWRVRYGYYQYFDHFLTRKFFFKLTAKSRKRFYKKLEKFLIAGGKAKIVDVDRVNDISQEDFMNKYVKKGMPLIITGQAKNWDCCKNWSLDYFKELHGTDRIVHINQEDIQTKEVTDTTLANVIEDLKSGNSSYYRFYPLLKRHPEHLLDFDYKWIRNRRIGKGKSEAFQIFLSGKGGFTPVHNASQNNIFTQVTGEKEWFLYPVQYTCIIDPDPARNLYRNSPTRNGVVFDPFKADYSGHDLYQYMDGYKVHLKAGDVFYNPGYMWHTVKNPTESIGVGYRYHTPIRAFMKSPLYLFLELFTFKPPIWKSWRNYDDINMIHLAETGELDKIAKKRGVSKIKSSVSAD
jgi:hypothetical protein